MPEVVEFRANGTGHNDIFLSLQGIERIADSYYLGLDCLDGTDESPSKILRVLSKLLQQWLEAVEAARDQEQLFLPYDFSDQGTGCLRCTRFGDNFLIEPGWSEQEGWSVMPSALEGYLTGVTDFHPGGTAAVILSVREFRVRIERAIKKADQTD